MLLACASAAAQECGALAPDPDQFRQTMHDSATREAELRDRLRKPVRIDYAIGLLRDYTGLVTRALTVIDEMETRANTAQERRCPGWEQAGTMEATALVIKDLKAKYKKTRTRVESDLAGFEAAMQKGHKGMVSVGWE